MPGQPILHSETMSVSKQQNNGLGYGSARDSAWSVQIPEFSDQAL